MCCFSGPVMGILSNNVMKTFEVTVSEPFLIVTELMANGALNKFLQTPVGQTLSQMVIYSFLRSEGK